MPRITPRCQDSGAYRLRCTPCSMPQHISLTSPLPYPFKADRLRLTSGPCYPAAFPRPSMSIHSPLLTLCIGSTLQCLTPHLAVCPPDGPRLCANTMPHTHTLCLSLGESYQSTKHTYLTHFPQADITTTIPTTVTKRVLAKAYFTCFCLVPRLSGMVFGYIITACLLFCSPLIYAQSRYPCDKPGYIRITVSL